MVMRPQPHFVGCNKCGWEEYRAPRSDALKPSDLSGGFSCPRCSSMDLYIKRADNIKGKLHGLLNGRMPWQ